MHTSLGDELAGDFEDIALSPADTLDLMESPKSSHEKSMGDTRSVDMVCEKRVEPTAACLSTPLASGNADPESPAILVDEDKGSTTANTVSDVALSQPPKKSKFVEHTSPVDSSSQRAPYKEHTKKVALINNRDLIERKADGFFNMETLPTATDVQRRVKQSEGIAALQRTLVPTTLSDLASISGRSSHASSSTAVDSVKRSSSLRQVTFAESSGRMSKKVHGPYPYAADRTKAAPRFSLARNLIAAGHKKRLSEPSAPARFVRLPTDLVVNFKRSFGESGLKIKIPSPELDEIEEGSPGSIMETPQFDSMDGFTFVRREPDVVPKLEVRVPSASMPDQCREASCPLRFVHAIGPYHHMGRRNSKIMTGLFGHANPPPEIWNAYLKMIHLTSKGEYASRKCPRPEADEDLVVAFAMFHFGKLNGMSGKEFHRRYAGKHMSSTIAVQSSRTEVSNGHQAPV